MKYIKIKKIKKPEKTVFFLVIGVLGALSVGQGNGRFGQVQYYCYVSEVSGSYNFLGFFKDLVDDKIECSIRSSHVFPVSA